MNRKTKTLGELIARKLIARAASLGVSPSTALELGDWLEGQVDGAIRPLELPTVSRQLELVPESTQGEAVPPTRYVYQTKRKPTELPPPMCAVCGAPEPYVDGCEKCDPDWRGPTDTPARIGKRMVGTTPGAWRELSWFPIQEPTDHGARIERVYGDQSAWSVLRASKVLGWSKRRGECPDARESGEEWARYFSATIDGRTRRLAREQREAAQRARAGGEA